MEPCFVSSSSPRFPVLFRRRPLSNRANSFQYNNAYTHVCVYPYVCTYELHVQASVCVCVRVCVVIQYFRDLGIRQGNWESLQMGA